MRTESPPPSFASSSRHGDRTDRNKARLKYVLDRFGLEKYLEETQKHLPQPLRKFPLEKCMPRGQPCSRWRTLAFMHQRDGKQYIGVVRQWDG